MYLFSAILAFTALIMDGERARHFNIASSVSYSLTALLSICRMLYTCCGPQANQTSNQERPEVSDSQEETTSTVALPPAEPMGLSPEYPANEPPMPAPELPLSPEEEIPEEEIYQTEEEEDPFLYKETA